MKQVIVSILRKKKNEDRQYWETFQYSGELNIPVTTLLERINQQEKIKNIYGVETEPIHYSCSCQQGLCGSCAFVVNDRPGLGCQVFCNESADRNHEIIIQPLSKFPVIHDLEVDRSEIFETMKTMKLWLNSKAKISQKRVFFEYEVSQCLMCGCCLEVCPNYKKRDLFAGIPVAVNAAKYVGQEEDKEHSRIMKKAYQKKFYKGCVKSFACEKICPTGIDGGFHVLGKLNVHCKSSFLYGIKE